MLCCSTGGTGRGSPAAALDPRWEAALPLHAWQQDEEQQRCISNAAVPEQGLGHPVPTPGPAWSRSVLGLASPLPVAKAVLGGLPFRGGAERGPAEPHLLFLLLPKPQGAALAGCLARGGSNGTVPEHPAGDSYSFLLLTLSALITPLSLH